MADKMQNRKNEILNQLLGGKYYPVSSIRFQLFFVSRFNFAIKVQTKFPTRLNTLKHFEKRHPFCQLCLVKFPAGFRRLFCIPSTNPFYPEASLPTNFTPPEKIGKPVLQLTDIIKRKPVQSGHWIVYFKIRSSKIKGSEWIILHLWISGWSGFRITLNSSGIITEGTFSARCFFWRKKEVPKSTVSLQ